MLLDDMLEAVKDKHSRKPISAEAYQRWRTNAVTRRLMEEIEIELLEALAGDNSGDSERILKEAIVKQAVKEGYEDILNWKPQELVGEEDED